MEKQKNKVFNSHGVEIDLESVSVLMDDIALCCVISINDKEDLTNQSFFDQYCEVHKKLYNEEFEPNKISKFC